MDDLVGRVAARHLASTPSDTVPGAIGIILRNDLDAQRVASKAAEIPLADRVAARHLAEQSKAAPKKVDDLFKEVKDGNPSYSDEQAWATAWSIYCKHVDPNGGHCNKSPSEYLKTAVSEEEAKDAAKYKRLVHEWTEEMLGFSKEMLKFKETMEGWQKKIPEGMLWEDLPDAIESAVRDMDKSIDKLRGHAHRLGS